MLFPLITLLTACEQVDKPQATTPPTYFEQAVSPPADSEQALPAVSLRGGGLPGEIIIDAGKIEAMPDGFRLPVFLKNITAEHAVDTITLKTFLPNNIHLKEVIAPAGFTTQLDGINGSVPVIYFHSFSVTADAYSPVIASDQPIFTLVLSGAPAGKIAVQGSFFRANGELLRTNRAVLQL